MQVFVYNTYPENSANMQKGKELRRIYIVLITEIPRKFLKNTCYVTRWNTMLRVSGLPIETFVFKDISFSCVLHMISYPKITLYNDSSAKHFMKVNPLSTMLKFRCL